MWRTINRNSQIRITTNTLRPQKSKQDFPDHLFPKGTYLIVGDSMLARIGKKNVRYFPGVRTDVSYDYMKPLLQKVPDYIILHH